MISDTRSPRSSRLALTLVYALLVISYFISYFFRVSTSILLPALAREWRMDATTMGVISSLYFYTYGLAQPISGVLNDRYGATKIVAAALALTGLGALLMGFAQTPLVFAIGRAITGLSLAPMLSGVLSFQSRAFSGALYTTLSGITYTVGNFGSVVSVGPLDHAIDRWGRGSVFVFLTLGSLAVAAILFLNSRHDVALRGPRPLGKGLSPILGSLSSAFRTAFGSGQLRRMLVIWCIYFASLMAFQGLWAVSWYEAAFGVSKAEASSWATLVGFGVMGGCLVGGYLWRPARSRKTAIVAGYAAYVASWVALWFSLFTASSLPLTGILGFVMGFMSGICSDHLTAGLNDLAAPGENGSLFGCVNITIYVVIILYQSGSGFLLSRLAGATGTVYDNRSFLLTFGIVVLTLLVSLLALPGLRSFEGKARAGKLGR